MQNCQKQLENIIEEVSRCRSRVMDDCEIEFGDSLRWNLFRSRLLRIFGERGLEGKIIEIMSAEETCEVSNG
ncbi:MAG: hypothetical protein ACXVCY_15050 [Pseudobdellovibrionaceae bacterium]